MARACTYIHVYVRMIYIHLLVSMTCDVDGCILPDGYEFHTNTSISGLDVRCDVMGSKTVADIARMCSSRPDCKAFLFWTPTWGDFLDRVSGLSTRASGGAVVVSGDGGYGGGGGGVNVLVGNGLR